MMHDNGHSVPNIRGKLTRVLLMSATVLSLLFGGAVFVYESWRAVQRFEAMAITAATALTARLADQCQSNPTTLDDTTLASFLAERYQVPGGHFVAVQIMDDAGMVLAKAFAPGFYAKPTHHTHPVPTTTRVPPHKELLIQEGELFVLVVRELDDVGDRFPGRFQGVFHIETDTRDHVVNAAVEAVVLTALTVLLTTVVLYPIITRLHQNLLVQTDELRRSHVSILQVLGSAIAKRDSDTHAHNFRVTFYAVRLAEAAGRLPWDIASLIKGAFLHDLGKIAISDTILLKPGRLTEEEMTIMRTHVAHGLDMVARVPWLADAMDVVGCHHERWDGLGYPVGLTGENIPVNARIFAIADVFDALTSRRPYKAPLPLDTVLEMMKAGRQTQFDPHLLDLFIPIAPTLLSATVDDAQMDERVFHLVSGYLET